MPKRKQKWSPGDVFAMPMPKAESTGTGQVVSSEKGAMDSVLCVYFGELHGSGALRETSALTPISLQLTTRDLLDSGDWKVLANQAVPIGVFPLFPLAQLREAGYVGAKIRGSGIMNTLVAAFNGLAPWNSYFEPDYLDSLLLPGISRPFKVVMR